MIKFKLSEWNINKDGEMEFNELMSMDDDP